MGSTARGRVGEECETGAGTTTEEPSVAAGAARVPSVLQPNTRRGVDNWEGGDAGVERAARRASDRGADGHVAPHYVRGVRSRTGSGRTAHRQTCSSSARRRPGARPHWDQGPTKGGYTRREREPRGVGNGETRGTRARTRTWCQSRPIRSGSDAKTGRGRPATTSKQRGGECSDPTRSTCHPASTESGGTS